MKKRFAFIHFPNFRHQQACIMHKQSPLVVIKKQHNALIVADVGPAEEGMGVYIGTPLADAKILIPNIVTIVDFPACLLAAIITNQLSRNVRSNIF